MKKPIAAITCIAVLSGCVPPQNQNTYTDGEIGKNVIVNFGKVVSERQVDIHGTNSGTGALGGAVVGGAAGSAIGRGNGSVAGLLVGVVAGAIAGGIAEQALKDRKGIEYIIRFRELKITRSIVQNIAKTDQPIPVGSCAMVQENGSYQRVLPATDPSLCNASDDSDKVHVVTYKAKRKKHADDDESDE